MSTTDSVIEMFKKQTSQQLVKEREKYLRLLQEKGIDHMLPIWKRGLDIVEDLLRGRGDWHMTEPAPAPEPIPFPSGENSPFEGGQGDVINKSKPKNTAMKNQKATEPKAKEVKITPATGGALTTEKSTFTPAGHQGVEIRNIHISHIAPDPSQPRKFLHPEELQELAQSITLHGILSPIMVRPDNSPRGEKSPFEGGKGDVKGNSPFEGGKGDVKGDVNYVIIFGERRYRAARIAGIDLISCMINNITPEAALEIQITENLQRSNPHPIEEALSYQVMRDVQHHTIQEIAHRAGKSLRYIANRLHLANLIPDFQQMCFDNRLPITDALTLGKLTHEIQAKVWSGAKCIRYKTEKDYTLNGISWMVREEEHNLDSATFKTEDPLLFPEAGPCNLCKFNSINTLLLFTEDEEKRICQNNTCFQVKTSRAFQTGLDEAIATNKLIISRSYSLSPEEEAQVKILKQVAPIIYNFHDYEKIRIETLPPLEEYIKEQLEDFEEEEIDDPEVFSSVRHEKPYTTAQAKEDFIEEVKEEYRKKQEGIEEELAELAADRAAGLIRKAFVANGSEKGTEIEVRITPEVLARITPAAAPSGAVTKQVNLEAARINSEIAELKSKEATALKSKEATAVKNEPYKLWESIRPIIHEANNTGNHYHNNTTPLSDIETVCSIMALLHTSSNDDVVRFASGLGLTITRYDTDNITLFEALLRQTHHNISRFLAQALRMHMKYTLYPADGSFTTSAIRAAGYRIAETHNPLQVEKELETHTAKNRKRTAITLQKITTLEKQLKPKK